MSLSNYYKERSRRASERAKRGWVKRHAEMAMREPNADDLRARALDARRGEVYATLQCANHATGRVTKLILRYSIDGRSDQFDVTVNGKPMKKPRGIVEIMKMWRSVLIKNRIK